MGDIDFLEAKVRGLEAETQALRQSLWDEFFKLGIPGAVKAARKHQKHDFENNPERQLDFDDYLITALLHAAEVADKALRVRNQRAGVTG